MIGVTVTGVTCALAGWMIGTEHAKLLLIALAIVGLCALALTQRGALIGILVLAGMNGLPYVDTSTLVTSKLAVEDLAVIALVIISGIWIMIDGAPPISRRVGRIISRVGLLLLLWWLFVMTRTVVGQHVPLLRAMYFGRDFASFALLLIVLPRLRLASRDISTLLGVLAAGVCVFAVGQIMTATGMGQPGSLIHFHYTLQESGLTRVYSNMTDLVTAGLAVSVAALLLARQRRIQLIALPIMILLGTSTAVQLTRARWIGLVVGISLTSLWLALNSNTRIGIILRRKLSPIVGALCFVSIIVIFIAPSIGSGGEVINRLTSIFTDLETGSGTVAIRVTVSKEMTVFLGEKWPFGLGFIPPFSHYYLGLPGGSIRDPDVGALNAVMTMGVLGAILIYIPVIAVLIDCLQRISKQWADEFSWLYYGGAIWILATLASSITLITLFSTSGLAFTALFLTILTRPNSSEAQQAATTKVVPGTSALLQARHHLTSKDPSSVPNPVVS